MSGLDTLNFIHEIRMLSGYLGFGHDNLMRFRQKLASGLNQSIDELRKAEDIHADVSNEEIISQVRVRDMHYKEADALDLMDENFENPVSNVSFYLDWQESTEQYDNTFYATILIMAYSIIERGLIKTFDLENKREDRGVIPQVYDILGNKPGHNIDNATRKELNNIRCLRNTILHSGMSFDLNYSYGEKSVLDSYGKDALVIAKPDLIIYLKSKKIYQKEYGQISLNLDYCKYVIDFADQFLHEINSIV